MIHKSDRVVITGCGGMLGEAVYAVFKGQCEVHASDIDVNTPWLDRLDVSNAKDVDIYLQKVKPNYIVHLAACQKANRQSEQHDQLAEWGYHLIFQSKCRPF